MPQVLLTICHFFSFLSGFVSGFPASKEANSLNLQNNDDLQEFRKFIGSENFEKKLTYAIEHPCSQSAKNITKTPFLMETPCYLSPRWGAFIRSVPTQRQADGAQQTKSLKLSLIGEHQLFLFINYMSAQRCLRCASAQRAPILCQKIIPAHNPNSYDWKGGMAAKGLSIV